MYFQEKFSSTTTTAGTGSIKTQVLLVIFLYLKNIKNIPCQNAFSNKNFTHFNKKLDDKTNRNRSKNRVSSWSASPTSCCKSCFSRFHAERIRRFNNLRCVSRRGCTSSFWNVFRRRAWKNHFAIMNYTRASHLKCNHTKVKHKITQPSDM